MVEYLSIVIIAELYFIGMNITIDFIILYIAYYKINDITKQIEQQVKSFWWARIIVSASQTTIIDILN